MARYPIKMLKDESGQPFVPLTHVSAVTGEEYTTTTLDAIKQTNGHYKITNDDLSTDLLDDKVIAVKFDSVSGAPVPSYLKFNNDSEYPLYQADGTNYLVISEYTNSVVFLVLNDSQWQLLKVATDTSASGGHGIADGEGNIMPQRNMVQFVNLNVEDIPGDGATRISNENWVRIVPGLGDFTTLNYNEWTQLSNPITITEGGLYRIVVNVKLNSIGSVGREIGITLTDWANFDPQWFYQYKRFDNNAIFYVDCPVNSTITPAIYIDPITSGDTAYISDSTIYIEHLYTKEVN